MGRYVPPDLEGVASFNQASGKGHALGSRANKSSAGILTVRFELPFSIWCTTCPKPTIIGQGVRFNAEKKKIGSYFSTPIYSFRFKHIACGGGIEIQTDPKNTAYVVTEGASKRDTGEDRLREGEIVIGGKTEEEKKRLEGDPFARLEEKVTDKRQANNEKSRIEDLYRHNSRDWNDPGEANRKLRKAFRVERKVRNRNAETTEALQERIGIGFDLLDETENDKTRAKLIDFGDSGTDDLSTKAHLKPLFHDPKITNTTKPKQGRTISQPKDLLHQSLATNTRAVLDPFLQPSSKLDQSKGPILLKRKRDRNKDGTDRPGAADRASAADVANGDVYGPNDTDTPPSALSTATPYKETSTTNPPSSKGAKTTPLVDYDSD